MHQGSQVLPNVFLLLEEPDCTFAMLALFFSWWIGKYGPNSTRSCILPFPKKSQLLVDILHYPGKKFWYRFNHFIVVLLFSVITVTGCLIIYLFPINLIQFRLYSSSLFRNILVLNKPFYWICRSNFPIRFSQLKFFQLTSLLKSITAILSCQLLHFMVDGKIWNNNTSSRIHPYTRKLSSCNNLTISFTSILLTVQFSINSFLYLRTRNFIDSICIPCAIETRFLYNYLNTIKLY